MLNLSARKTTAVMTNVPGSQRIVDEFAPDVAELSIVTLMLPRGE